MIKKFITIALSVLVWSIASSQSTHNVMTCNIRITGLDADEVDGRRWDDRKDVCLKVIKSRKPDIICMQEVIYESYGYMKKKLSDYMAFGFEGPEMDPWTDGYHLIGKNVIFFSRKRYELVAAGSYWLSETPLIGGSISWESSRARQCNWVRLRDRKTGREFRVLDTHLDHINSLAKTRQAEVIAGEAAQYAADFPQLLFGDFNTGIKDEPYAIFTAAGWQDAYEMVHGHEETGFTAHGWRLDRPKGRRIDFIYTRGGVEALEAEIVKDAPGGIYPSDHYFVYAKLKF
ncbi:MAG: endonuclease/exonuclease/phosphatase family protein [Bacteroidales bacterium]|nr:endonuclease/exonuclease/phosphatase family protein [Bacteroidales bacterium]